MLVVIMNHYHNHEHRQQDFRKEVTRFNRTGLATTFGTDWGLENLQRFSVVPLHLSMKLKKKQKQMGCGMNWVTLISITLNFLVRFVVISLASSLDDISWTLTRCAGTEKSIHSCLLPVCSMWTHHSALIRQPVPQSLYYDIYVFAF